jgi:hypothetical protein
MDRIRRLLHWIVAPLVLIPSCKDEDAALKKGEAATSAAAVPSEGPSAVLAPVPLVPTVKVPAGQLKAGVACGEAPRVTTEELVGAVIPMGEFTIDVLPYPNDPSKPVRVDVSRDEAQALCVEGGKRLCTELEWERACKGPSNTTFEYGPVWNAASCKQAVDLLPDKRPKCVSGFGVKDMHGLVFEWTSSPWGRGTSGDLGGVRGGQGPAGAMQARCANGQSRPRETKAKDLGFRCCGGSVNAAQVNLTLQTQPPMVPEPSVEAGLAAGMLRVMPIDHRAVAAAEVSFDKVWRWHPRANEELLIGRWTVKPKDDNSPYHELAVFKVCSGVPALVARMRGPVTTLGDPGAGADPQKVSAPVAMAEDKGDLKLSYVYGAVQIEQPAWIKVGNAPGEEKDKKKSRRRIKLRTKTP